MAQATGATVDKYRTPRSQHMFLAWNRYVGRRGQLWLSWSGYMFYCTKSKLLTQSTQNCRVYGFQISLFMWFLTISEHFFLSQNWFLFFLVSNIVSTQRKQRIGLNWSFLSFLCSSKWNDNNNDPYIFVCDTHFWNILPGLRDYFTELNWN